MGRFDCRNFAVSWSHEAERAGDGGSGTGVSPVSFGSPGRDARATTRFMGRKPLRNFAVELGPGSSARRLAKERAGHRSYASFRPVFISADGLCTRG